MGKSVGWGMTRCRGPGNIEGSSGSVNGGRWGVKVLGWVLCGALTLGQNSVAMAQSGNEIYYVALGDSISSGFGLEEEAQRFTQQVASENGFVLTSLAQNGETSETLLQRLQDPETMEVVAQADVITMTVGGNDLMHALYVYLADQYQARNPDGSTTVDEMQAALMGGDMAMLTFALGEIQGFPTSEREREALEQYSDNLTQLLTTIQTANPEACLVLVNQYNPYSHLLREFSKYPPLADAAQDVQEAFGSGVAALNGVIASVGEQMECLVVDVYTAFEGAQENPCNADVSAFAKVNLDFHPNVYGHCLIAQAVAEATSQQNQSVERDVQSVSGETTKITQSSPKHEYGRWSILLCGVGIALLSTVIWGRKTQHRGH